jgi:hypothetical protein
MKDNKAILIALTLIIYTMVPLAIADEPVIEDDIGNILPPVEEFDTFSVYESTVKGSPYTTEQIVDTPVPPFDTSYWWDGDFGWQHTFTNPESKNILSATLEIRAWDVDTVDEFGVPYGDPELDVVTADGNNIGTLVGQDEQWTITTFNIDPNLLSDGELDIWLDIDSTHDYNLWNVAIDWSKLIVVWVPCLKVEKTLEASREVGQSDYAIPEFVPIFTNVEFDLNITVENPDDDYDDWLNDTWIYDGIGAKLDLVIQNDGGGDYIFVLDGTPLYLNSETGESGDDDEYYGDHYIGETMILLWRQASDKAFDKGKHCATNVWWNVSDLNDDDPTTTLEFRVETIEFEVNGNKNKVAKTKQAFTSTCHHELNDGPIATYWFEDNMYNSWGDPLIVSVYDPDPEADSDGDGYYDIGEVGYGTDPCCPDNHPILVSGFNSDRSRAPLVSGPEDDLETELLDTDNFGWGGIVQCPIIFLDFVETIATESLVDADNNLLVDVFFAPLTDVDLTTDEAAELKAFLEAGGILYVCGNSEDNEGPSYHPLFTELGWTDTFLSSTTGGTESTIPVTTPVTDGPFGIVGNLSMTIFRPFLYNSAICVAEGPASNCLVAESAYGLGYISIQGDPLYFDLFMSDIDNVNYFLNLFALAV